MNTKSKFTKLAGVTLLSSIAGSLCCITPVLAILSGTSGVVSSVSWMEAFRPYLVGVTLVLLGFAWYQKLKPPSAAEIYCDCGPMIVVDALDEKQPFMQTKKFLVITTVITLLMMAFPYYATVFYPEEVVKERVVFAKANLQKVEYKINGMTCEACAAAIANEVSTVNGVFLVTPSFQNKNISIQFDALKTNESALKKAIDATGYKVDNHLNKN